MDSAMQPWSADSLASFVSVRLADVPLVVVSNRERYIHEARPEGLRWIRPASGLVTALDPVLRAAGGTWIAHGAGSGDRAAVDAQDRVPVPPDHPRYTLRRVWLTEAQERGYYYGFANETLWPLCHIAYVRPRLLHRDWQAYRDANEYVAARVDGDGTLLLSEFTGAARELHDALLVNPYDVDATAARLAAGLCMPEAERRRRMERLRKQVRQSNIYRWAADTLDVLARLAATRAAA